MKKIVSGTLALLMAFSIAGTAGAEIPATAYKGTSTTSDNSQVEMKEALKIVKKRLTIPQELSEFDYSSYEEGSVRAFEFVWSDKKNTSRITVNIVGEIITYCKISGKSSRTQEPRLAKLSQEKLLEKAKGYIKQFNPGIEKMVKLEIRSYDLFSDMVYVDFKRYENGVAVKKNTGTVCLNKNTGELINIYTDWWGNASFEDTNGMLSESEIENEYKKLCDLTPRYKINSDREKNEKTGEYFWKKNAVIVYEPDMTSEIDAFTGKPSTIWEDMLAADGNDAVGGYGDMTTDAGAAEEVEEECDEEGFTTEELEKIEQDENLIKPEEAFKQLKKDKYVALTDDYEMSGYDVYYTTDSKTDEETFFLRMDYKVKQDKRENYKGYKNVTVTINAETGDVISFNKYSKSSINAKKLDVSTANQLANEITKKYSADIISQYRPSAGNTAPVSVYTYKDRTEYETSRGFQFERYVNGINVHGDTIWVEIDADNTVSRYTVNHTEDVVFPSADILSEDEAFEKLYEQRDFDLYYDGWITSDGSKVNTYLIYKMDRFYLNAKTGKLCNWSGGEPYTFTSAREVRYSDINGIPQEEAIRTMQQYGIVLTTDSKFRPDELITEAEFSNLLSSTLGGYEAVVEEDIEEDSETPKNNTKETTVREAAVMFGKIYLPADVASMDIFKSPFSDIKDSDPDAGYLAVANDKGFYRGRNGKLSGNSKLTRTEAVQMLYDYIKYVSK